jgi:hypothetical protein
MKKLATLILAATIAGAALSGTATAGQQAASALTCRGQTSKQAFLPWLDPANYVLLQNGALESTSGWSLTGGAKLAAGNEPFHVNAAKDASSLVLPSGSSATSPPLCVTLLHPTLRFFALNTGSALSLLQVEAITTIAGLKVAVPIGFLAAGHTWQPTLPLPFLANLLSPIAPTVSFRFTPIGSGSGWRIDDTYVDPYKSG